MLFVNNDYNWRTTKNVQVQDVSNEFLEDWSWDLCHLIILKRIHFASFKLEFWLVDIKWWESFSFAWLNLEFYCFIQSDILLRFSKSARQIWSRSNKWVKLIVMLMMTWRREYSTLNWKLFEIIMIPTNLFHASYYKSNERGHNNSACKNLEKGTQFQTNCETDTASSPTCLSTRFSEFTH